MKAIELSEYGKTLHVAERPEPQPGPGQVRVRVQAAAVNPIDGYIASGAFAGWSGHIALPVVLGFDAAGVVDAVGAGAPFETGQQVVVLAAWFERGEGTFAEQVVADAGCVAPAPSALDPVLAATVPLAGTTAQMGLDLLPDLSGRTVLVTGASGAVGGFAVQLAAAERASVVAVASPGDEERVRALGAAVVLTRQDDLIGAVRRAAPGGVDAALDAAPVGASLIGAVRDGGAFVTVMDSGVPAEERDVQVSKVSASAQPALLERLLAELGAGRLTTSVAAQLPLAEAADALALVGKGGLRGKVVLVP